MHILRDCSAFVDVYYLYSMKSPLSDAFTNWNVDLACNLSLPTLKRDLIWFCCFFALFDGTVDTYFPCDEFIIIEIFHKNYPPFSTVRPERFSWCVNHNLNTLSTFIIILFIRLALIQPTSDWKTWTQNICEAIMFIKCVSLFRYTNLTLNGNCFSICRYIKGKN